MGVLRLPKSPQSFFGEQRLSALAAARPHSLQMNFASRTRGLSFFRSILPAFDPEPLAGGGWTVRIRDVRYSGFGGRGPGAATVTLDASLRVVAVRSGS